MIFSLARVPATNTTSCVANVNFASFNNWFTDGCTQSNFPDISGREKFKETLMKYWNNENKKSKTDNRPVCPYACGEIE